MGRLIVWVSMASLVLVMVAAAWLAWRGAGRLSGWRRVALAAGAGLLAVLPGAGLAAACIWLAGWFSRRHPWLFDAFRAEVALDSYAPFLYELEAPSCAR